MEPKPPTYLLGERQEDGTIIVRPSTAQQILPSPPAMEPGKTYVARLPGHSRPAFVRQRRKPPKLRSGFSAMTEALVSTYIPLRSQSAEAPRREVRVSSAPVAPSYVVRPAQQPLQLEYSGAQNGAVSQQPMELVQSAPPVLPPPFMHYKPQPSQPVEPEVARRHGRRRDIALQHTCASCGKFRSPSYHHRHPLAPDEVPKPGICRKCMKVQTSSDESTEERSRSRESRRRKRSSKKKKKKERPRRTSSVESDGHGRRFSSKEEVIRITRRTGSSGSRDRRRREPRGRRQSPSSLESQAQIQVTYKPGKKKAKGPSDRTQVIERVRYIEAAEHPRSISRSRSRSSLRPRSRSSLRSRSRSFGFSRSRSRGRYDEPDDFVRVHRPAEQRLPIQFTTYRQDQEGNIVEERHQETEQLPSRRRSNSTSAQQGTPYLIHQRDNFQPPVRSSRHDRERSRFPEDSFEYDNHDDIASQSRSRSVRLLRVSHGNLANSNIHSWESDGADIGPPRVTFAPEGPVRRTSPAERGFSEDRLPLRRRRRRVRDIDDLLLDERSGESHSNEQFGPPRAYRDVRVPTPPSAQWRPHERYSTSGPHREEREITHMLETTRITPSMSPPSGRGRATSLARNPSRSRSASSYRPPYYRQATAGGTEQGPFRYVYIGANDGPEEQEWEMGPSPAVREHTW